MSTARSSAAESYLSAWMLVSISNLMLKRTGGGRVYTKEICASGRLYLQFYDEIRNGSMDLKQGIGNYLSHLAIL